MLVGGGQQGQEGLALHGDRGGGQLMFHHVCCADKTGTSLTSHPGPCPPPPTWSAPPAGAVRRGAGWWSCH